ncbi:cell envelope integrity protein TolA [Rossellomorea vietnamensis]|uniref:Uncharacterized protein n=1 Tax=Rossellomorea vietnamensis TaxID=218284 RepID=A0A0P6VWA7_9BACI|nr:cell envelope integrity protein TolA [Rossellomorea vietnamensis]KPL59300.1 hypothetical protein AM506_12340 [Rossellomorea vietnamensis]
MNPLHNGLKGNRPLITFCAFLILSFIYFISIIFTSLPGTYAWFTSETSASGTIQNATTEDLLQIGSSEITYGDDCYIEHSLSVKNISDMSTNVTIFHQTGSGEEQMISQKLKPGESLKTAPDAISDPSGGCEATSVDYHIKGFVNYVDETFSVAVDPEKMIQPIVPQPEEAKVEEKPEEQDETKVEETEKAEPKEKATDTEGKSPVMDEEEEEAKTPVVKEPEQEEKPVYTPQVEEDASSKAQPEEKVIEEANEDKQVEDVKEEQSEQAKAIAGE